MMETSLPAGGFVDMEQDDSGELEQVESEFNRMATEKDAKATEEKETKRQQADWERGFRAGAYSLSVRYPHRDGGERSKIINGDYRVEDEDTREAVAADMRGWVALDGLHNFGLKVGSDGRAEVKVELVESTGNSVFEQDLLLNGSGNIVRK